MRKSALVSVAIIILSCAFSAYFYPQMPDEIASHWNIKGEVDSYMPKFWGLAITPLVGSVLLLMFILIPRIDPLKRNVLKFMFYFEGFVVLIFAFLFYVQLLVILWNIGFKFSIIAALMPSIGILFYYSGIVMEKSKKNWFIGIRNPWTLSNDKVWNKTHKISGKLFKISGILSFLGMLFQDYAFVLVFVPIFASIIYITAYSYLQYKKHTK